MKPPLSATNLRQMQSNASSGAGSHTTPKTGGVTYSQQDQLPLLPIPDLDITLQRLKLRLDALQRNEQQRQQTARDIQEFLIQDGPILHQKLREYEAEGRAEGMIGSYVEEFWNEAYLQPDMSVVLNLNPYFVLEGSPDPKIATHPLRRAASLTYAALQMVSLTKDELLVPDTFRNQPLCMHQFKSLFASSRQPTLNGMMDDVHVFNDSTHVVVLCQNQFYYFFALWPDQESDDDGSRRCTVAVNESDIYDILLAIQTHATSSASHHNDSSDAGGIGVFTSLPRSQWAVIRHEICDYNEAVNIPTLRMIDSALFILVLDDYVPTNIHMAAANMLHGTNLHSDRGGDGGDIHHAPLQIGTCLNRWYDKLQLIVCADGTSGLIFEHSTVDGHTALRFASDVFAETIITFAESIIDLIHGRGTISHVVNAPVERAVIVNRSASDRFLDVRPKKLMFHISKSIADQIGFAEAFICDEIQSTDTYVLEYKQYGKRLIVANNMSPDAFVQMSILLAYYTIYGKVECMYEPALTKQFFHGRTEAIRGTTVQAKEFCQVYHRAESTDAQKLQALQIATNEHSRLTKEAAAGQGVDRLLFALQCIALRTNEDGALPPFFSSDAWKTLNHTVLSTSNCGNPALRLFGFGPVVPNGFGIGYIIKDDAISYSVCSKRRQTLRYVQSLERCLNEIQSMLQPISSVSVDQHVGSRELNQATQTVQKRVDTTSYDDIWGENESIFIDGTNQGEHSTQQTRFSSLYSRRVHEQSIRGNLLSVSAVDILPNNDEKVDTMNCSPQSFL